jgi:hypothetical protein
VGPAELANGFVDVPQRQVGQADLPFGLHRAEVGQPLVVHVAADAGQLVVDVVGPAHGGDADRRIGHHEGDGLAVLAAVEDDFGGHAVAVEVAHALVRVVVARCA